MDALVSLVLTFVLMASSAALVATVGRRRRRTHALARASVRAIEGAVGVDLAAVVVEANTLRQQIETVLASSREMLTIEVQLGPQLRRPLWRQIEDANFGHDFASVRRDTHGWLARFDGLDSTARQIVERLGLDVGSIRAFAELDEYRSDAYSGHAVTRKAELEQIGLRSIAAIDDLRRLERELTNYRPSGYR